MRTALCIFCGVGAVISGAYLCNSTSPPQSLRADPEMDELVKAIHVDLMALRSKHSWLSGYRDADLHETAGRAWILYVRPEPPDASLPQKSEQIAISYVPLNYSYKGAKGGENCNELRTIRATRFPKLKSKLQGCVLVRHAEEANLRGRLLELIERRCAEFQKR